MVKDMTEAHAIFKILTNERGDQIEDAEFIRVNPVFCRYAQRTMSELRGYTFLEVFPYGNNRWFKECLSAAKFQEKGENLSFYSSIMDNWVKVAIYPSKMKDCAIVIFRLPPQYSDQEDMVEKETEEKMN